MSPQEPVRLGEYNLLEKLGQGGMAMVYRAERVGEAGFKKKVAIKRMLPAYRRDRSLLERFAAEARTNARLDHPNLVQVVDFGIDPEPYLVMEFVEGITLATLLQRLVEQRQQLEIAAACFIGAEAAQGLEHAHRRRDEQGNPLGIVHRDVSPQNVMLSSEGAVKVSDFGLVKAADNVVQTGSGMPIGKMSYMAPEQADHMPVDARADVFALGIVVWEMLTMRTLLAPSDPARSSAMLQACAFHPPSRYNPRVSPALDDIVMRCLTKDPEERTPSAQALSMQLREVLHELAPGYDREPLARLLGWAFPEMGFRFDEPHETAAQPSAAERLSMPQMIPAAEAMAQAQVAAQAQAAAQGAVITGRHSAAEAVVVTGRHSAEPVVPRAHASLQAPAPPQRSSALLWVLLAVGGGIVLLAFAIVALAALFVVARTERTEPAAEVPVLAPPQSPLAPPSLAQPSIAQPSIAPAPMAPSPSAPAGLTVDTNVTGTRLFLGAIDLGFAPVHLTTDSLDGQPLVAIAPGHQPQLVAAGELARAVSDGRGRHLLSLAPSTEPDRAVFVRYPRPASARVAFTNEPLGPVPGLVIVRQPPAAEAPQIEIVEPGFPAVRISIASCPADVVCVLEGGAL